MSPRLFLILASTFGAVRASAAEPTSAPATTPVAATPAAPAPEVNKPAVTPPAAAVKTTAPTAAAAKTPRVESSIVPTASFDTFRLVSDRNIFNPNRTGRRDRTNEDKPPRLDVISLVGTMDSDRGVRAFFDGSETSYRKALRVGESVEKFKVTQITANAVTLEADGKSMAVSVGQQMRRPEGADWALVGQDVVLREAQAKAAAESKVDPNAPLVIPAGASEIEKRMMERRMKDLKK